LDIESFRSLSGRAISKHVEGDGVWILYIGSIPITSTKKGIIPIRAGTGARYREAAYPLMYRVPFFVGVSWFRWDQITVMQFMPEMILAVTRAKAEMLM
jgi:hypothetical protein